MNEQYFSTTNLQNWWKTRSISLKFIKIVVRKVLCKDLLCLEYVEKKNYYEHGHLKLKSIPKQIKAELKPHQTIIKGTRGAVQYACEKP